MKSSRKKHPVIYFKLLLCLALVAVALTYAFHKSKSAPDQEGAATNSVPRVVVSILPLHSLVAGVMEGVGEPYLLLKPGESPHHYNIKPKEAQEVASANIVVATSFAHEYYLPPLLANVKDHFIATIEMVNAPGITLHPAIGAHDQDEGYDLHLWLDPQNAIAFTHYIATALAGMDKSHADTYVNNAEKQIAYIENLNNEIKQKIPVGATAGYVSFHSVLQYFEKRYGIQGGEAVAAVPEAGASVSEAESVYQQASQHQIKCVLAETEFSSKLLDQVAAKYPEIKQLPFDPMGGQFRPSSQQYGELMNHVTDTVTQCLK